MHTLKIFPVFLHSRHCQRLLTSLNCSILTTGECISAPGRQFSGYFVFTVPTFHSIVSTPAASHSPASSAGSVEQEFPRLRESKCSLGCCWWLHFALSREGLSVKLRVDGSQCGNAPKCTQISSCRQTRFSFLSISKSKRDIMF